MEESVVPRPSQSPRLPRSPLGTTVAVVNIVFIVLAVILTPIVTLLAWLVPHVETWPHGPNPLRTLVLCDFVFSLCLLVVSVIVWIRSLERRNATVGTLVWALSPAHFALVVFLLKDVDSDKICTSVNTLGSMICPEKTFEQRRYQLELPPPLPRLPPR
jgi:hypothetical protein